MEEQSRQGEDGTGTERTRKEQKKCLRDVTYIYISLFYISALGFGRIVSCFFFCLCNSKVILYSNGLHVPEEGGPLHYTVFGFCELGGTLKQRWAMHIDEDGTSSCVFSKKRCISWEDITPLSVCKFITTSLLFILFYFFQRLTC
jgi:hypothetical protein